MQVSVRSYLTAGIAALGAGAMALTPVQPLPHDAALVPAQVTDLAIGLASSIDPITPWIDTFQDAANNIVGLFNSWAEAPFPILQQVIANQISYLGQLPDIGGIITQIVTNVGNAIMAPFTKDLSTLDELHNVAWIALPQLFDIPAILQPVLDFTTNFTTGALLGLVSPFIAPVVALANSVTSAISSIVTDNDFIAALNTLINIPAAMVNGFLNGGPVLNLTPLVNLLNIPDIDKFGIALGGLLSQGGSLFNTLDMVVTVELAPGFPVTLPIAGVPAGTIGSVIGLTNSIADAITPEPAASARAAAASDETPAVEATDDTPVATAYSLSEEAPVALGAEAPEDASGTDAPAEEAADGDIMTMTGASPEVIRSEHRTTPRRAHAASSSTASSGTVSQSDDAPKASAGRGSAHRAH